MAIVGRAKCTHARARNFEETRREGGAPASPRNFARACACVFRPPTIAIANSLRSKRFGKAFRTFDALFAFLAAGKLGRVQKSAWRERGKERRKRLHGNPTILKNAPLTPSQLDEFIACVASVSVRLSACSMHFSLFWPHFFALAPIFARLKNKKCLERAENLTETLATQATSPKLATTRSLATHMQKALVIMECSLFLHCFYLGVRAQLLIMIRFSISKIVNF